MADSDKNILITPNTGSTTDSPKIEFTGGDANTVTLTTLDDGTLSFSGTSGQLFSISDSLTGTIFSVNDVSGIPSIEVDDDGTVRLAEFGGNLLIGTDVDTNSHKMQLVSSVSQHPLYIESAFSDKIKLKSTNTSVSGNGIDFFNSDDKMTGSLRTSWSSSFKYTELYQNFDTSADQVRRLRLKPGEHPKAVYGATEHNIFNDNYHPNADKWTTAKTLTLSGDLTGSVSFDGSSNFTLSAQVVNDSHTHDTRYVQQGGTSFSGEYPMVVRVSDRNFYSDGNIRFEGATSKLTVDGIVNTPTYQVNGTTVIDSSRNFYANNLYATRPIFDSESTSDDALVSRWRYGSDDSYQLNIHQRVTSGVVRWSFGQVNNGTTYNDLIVLDRGKVGVGTQNPSQLLDVNGNIAVNGTTVIDSSRNLVNINNITHTGNQYWNGHIYWGSSKNIYVQSGECSFDVSTSAQWRVWDATNSIDAIKVTGGSQVEIGEAGSRGLKVFGATNSTTGYQVNGTTVIDSSRNLTNIGNITSSNTINVNRSGNGNAIVTKTGSIINFQVENYTTQTTIRSDTGTLYFWQPNSSYQMKLVNNGAVSLAYDGTWRLDTTSTGILATGHISRFSGQQNGESRLELFNNRQDQGNVPVYSIVGYNGSESSKATFYRGSGGSGAGYIRFATRSGNSASMQEVFQIGENSDAWGVNVITGGYRVGGTTVIDSARNAIGFVDIKGSGSYHEFGDSIGSVSNDGSWNARLNLAGSQHARLDVKSVSDGIITSMYSHTGQGVGKVGTISNHPTVLMVNGSEYARVDTNGLDALALGVTNSANNTGKGLSLYAGVQSGMPTYGISFAGTATFGTHGGVTSDWATYFTMNDNTNRGWIFKRGSTNVASIDGSGDVNFNDITGRGKLYFNKDGQTGYHSVIDIDHIENNLWAMVFQSSTVGNDNESGFWIGNNGYPDMRLRRDNETVRAKISSWEQSFVSYGFDVQGMFTVGSGTSNSQSTVARIGADGGNGELNALSLVNSRTGALGNAVALTFHNANNWSPTGKIVTVQRGGSATDSSLEFYGYDGGLLKQVEIDYLGNHNLLRGGYQINGTTVIDSNRDASFASLTVYGQTKAEAVVSSTIGAMRMLHPKGAAFLTSSSTFTGYMKITLPNSWTNTMLAFTIKVYEYSMHESFEIRVGGYNHTSGWINTTAYIVGSPEKTRNFRVRFAHDGSKCCVLIGESNSTWSYPQIAVTDFMAGYSGFGASNWDDGWSIGFNTSSGTVYKTHSINQVSAIARNGGEIGSYIIAMEMGNDRTARNLGDTVAGSSLRPASILMSNSPAVSTTTIYRANIYAPGSDDNSTLSGTWKLMGAYADSYTYNDYPMALWLRVL